MKVWLLFAFWASHVLAASSQVPEVKAVRVSQVAAEEKHHYIAQIEANQEAVLSTPFPASIVKIHTSLGAKVFKGQKLFSLEHLQPEFSLRVHTLQSPIDGEVADVLVKAGNQVSQDTKLIRIISINDIVLTFYLPQKDRLFVQKDMQGVMTVEGIKQAFLMQVASISPTVDALTGTFKATLQHIENKESNRSLLCPGMIGRLTLVRQKRSVLAIPANAVFWRKDKFFARVAKEGKAMQQEVVLGQDLDNGLKEITSGLTEQDLVIVNAPKYLRDKESITLTKEERS